MDEVSSEHATIENQTTLSKWFDFHLVKDPKNVDQCQKKLVIFDLDMVLCCRFECTRGLQPELGDVGLLGFIFRPRKYLKDCLDCWFQHFDIAIWGSDPRDNVIKVIKAICKPSHVRMFKFIFGREQCQTILANLRYGTISEQRIVLLKNLGTIWKEYKDHNSETTLFFTSRVYETSANLSHTCLYLYPYTGDEKDRYLHVYVTAILASIRYARSVRSFLLQCTPKWSSDMERDSLLNSYIHKSIIQENGHWHTKQIIHSYPILSISSWELSQEQRFHISLIVKKVHKIQRDMFGDELYRAHKEL